MLFRLVTCVALGLALEPAVCHAQAGDADREEAERIFREAGEAMDARAFDTACPKFEQVVHLQPGKVGAIIALAECYEAAGRTASALSAFRNAGRAAVTAGDARVARVTTKVAELMQKVPRVVLVVPDALRTAPGLVVRVNGTIASPADWKDGVPVDPGDVQISASADAKGAWSLQTRATTGLVTIEVPLLQEATAAGATAPAREATAASAAAPARAEAPPAPAADTRAVSEERRVAMWVWIVGSSALASGGTAVAFAVDQSETQGTFDKQCKIAGYDASRCGDLANQLRGDFGLALGFGAAAGLGIGAAVYGIVRAPRAGASTLRPSVVVGPRLAAGGLSGQF